MFSSSSFNFLRVSTDRFFRYSISMKSLQEGLAVLKILDRFSCILRGEIFFLMYEVVLIVIVQNLFNLKFVFFLSLEMKFFLYRRD